MSIVGGCSVGPQQTTEVVQQMSQESPSPFEFAEVPEFERDAARITQGMTKDEVLAELPKSGRTPFQLRFRSHDSTEAAQKQDIWTLLYGSGKATAPGSGEIRLTFSENKTVKIEHRHLNLK